MGGGGVGGGGWGLGVGGWAPPPKPPIPNPQSPIPNPQLILIYKINIIFIINIKKILKKKNKKWILIIIY
jgi:hypothetical protein